MGIITSDMLAYNHLLFHKRIITLHGERIFLEITKSIAMLDITCSYYLLSEKNDSALDTIDIIETSAKKRRQRECCFQEIDELDIKERAYDYIL
ncbi:MAG: hypothetical protein Q6370_025125 [Candidatus Sigynarchaeota archaeon]